MQLTFSVDSAAGGLATGLCIGAVVGSLAVASHCGKLTCIWQLCGLAKTSKCQPKHLTDDQQPQDAQGTPVAIADECAADRQIFYFDENLSDVYGVRMVLRRMMFDGRSEFQRVQVVETEQFGKTLVLDGQTQSALKDEKQYHETLVHPAMLQHPKPKSVFIGGGGEFATAREVLRHASVERCVMVDIDELTCDMCREHLPEWGNGAYDDKRFFVAYTDARVWLEEHDEMFDVMIMDICDPIEAGPGYRLYTQEFYEFCKTRLNDGGVLVTQSGPCAIYNAKEECFTVINSTLRSAFNCVVPFSVDIPSFGCCWGFNMAMNVGDGSAEAGKGHKERVLDMQHELWDEALTARVPGDMFFLDGMAMCGLFGVPKSIRDSCEEEKRVMTIQNPVFMYSG